jgi:hypothetical protein
MAHGPDISDFDKTAKPRSSLAGDERGFAFRLQLRVLI